LEECIEVNMNKASIVIMKGREHSDTNCVRSLRLYKSFSSKFPIVCICQNYESRLALGKIITIIAKKRAISQGVQCDTTVNFNMYDFQ